MSKAISIKILDEVLGNLNISLDELAEEIGSTYSTLHSILNKSRTTTISKNVADKIVKRYPQFSKAYLLTGEGRLLFNDNYSEDNRIDELITIVKDLKNSIDKTNSIRDKYADALNKLLDSQIKLINSDQVSVEIIKINSESVHKLVSIIDIKLKQ